MSQLQILFRTREDQCGFHSAGWNLDGAPPFQRIDTQSGKTAEYCFLARLKLIFYCFGNPVIESC
jgi:hypothetical protein